MRVYTLRWTRTANRFRQSTKAFTEAFYPVTPAPLRNARTMTPALAAWALISRKHLHHSLAVAHSPDYLSSTNGSLDARRHRHQSENEYLHKLRSVAHFRTALWRVLVREHRIRSQRNKRTIEPCTRTDGGTYSGPTKSLTRSVPVN